MNRPKLHFLTLPKFPTIGALWANLARTRMERRHFTNPNREIALQFAGFYGITAEMLPRFVSNLRLREKLIENKIARIQSK